MTWQPLCKLTDLEESNGKEFAIGEHIIAAFLVNGEVLAVDGMCAHQGGPIAQGQVEGTCVTCPWHGWQYDITSGCNLLTGRKMLETFSTEIRDGEVWIEFLNSDTQAD